MRMRSGTQKPRLPMVATHRIRIMCTQVRTHAETKSFGPNPTRGHGRKCTDVATNPPYLTTGSGNTCRTLMLMRDWAKKAANAASSAGEETKVAG